MRAIAAFTVVGAVAVFPSSAAGQDKVVMRMSEARSHVPIVTVAPVMTADDTRDDPAVAARRLFDEWSHRLRPIEQRVRENPHLRRAGALVGLSAAAIGAVRGDHALTFVGSEALRLGLDKQLAAIRARSGLVVEPTIGHRSVSITISKTFVP